jgi:hypothetical protein
MSNDYKSGLDDQDELGQFPSAASPLAALGIDPDEARANPEFLARLMKGPSQGTPLSSPSPSAVAAGATGGAGDTEPTDEEGYGRAGLSKTFHAMSDASKAANAVPTETPADITRLQSQEEKLQPKTPLRDASGNMLDQYKPSTGQKIWRGVRGGLTGLATGGVLGAGLGAAYPQDVKGGTAYNAPNKQYERTEQKRTQDLSATESNLDQARKNWGEAVKARQAQAGEFGKVAALGKDLTTGATGLINAENKPETEENKTKAKLELSQKEFEQRRQSLTTDPTLSKLSPLQKALYMANGKLPDPREPNEADVQAANMARALTTFKLQTGRAPQTLEEMNSVIATAKGELNKGKGANNPDAANLRVAARLAETHLKELQNMMKAPSIAYGSPEVKKQLQDQVDEAKERYDDLQEQLTQATGPTQTPAATPAQPAPAAPAASQPAKPAQNAPATKPQPAPDGTRRQAPNGTIEVKQNGKWVPES